MNVKRFIFLIISVSVTQLAVAQNEFREGFIVTESMDTIYGLVSYNDALEGKKYCIFKKSEGSPEQIFKASDLFGYGFVDDRQYESKIIEVGENEKEEIFLQVLVKGDISLYRDYKRYFAEKGDTISYELSNEYLEKIKYGVVHNVKSNRYVAMLRLLMTDCEEVQNKIHRTPYREKSLTELVTSYNNCIDDPSGDFSSVVYKENKKWIQLDLGLFAGVNFSKLDFAAQDLANSYLTEQPYKDVSPLIGSYLEIGFPRINERLSLQTGIHYVPVKYSSSSFHYTGYATQYNDVSIALDQLKIPVGIKFSMISNSLEPYINLGYSRTIYINSSSLYYNENDKTEETYEGIAFEMTKSQQGLWAGVGIKNKLFSKFKFFVELRVEQTGGIVENPLYSFTRLQSDIVNVHVFSGIQF